MLWLVLLFISNAWLVAGTNCPGSVVYTSCASISNPSSATCANGVIAVTTSSFFSCYWDSAQPTTCLQSSTSCSPICSTGGRSLITGFYHCYDIDSPTVCSSSYIDSGFYEFCDITQTGPGVCTTTQFCYKPGNCPATTAVVSCSGLPQITCPTRFVWNGGPIHNCVWNSSTSTCVASTDTCVPPCLPVGRIPTSACSNGNTGTCLGLTSTSASKYCALSGSTCVDGLSCYTKPDCTTTTAIGFCPGLSQPSCVTGFTWNNGPIDNCSWNGSSCVEVAAPCTPPCIPSTGRTDGVCSIKSQSSCIRTSNTATKRYCDWNGVSCVESELCHYP